MMTNDTVRKMNELKLFGMAHAFTAQVESANATHLSFEERIGLIIDHEVTYRDDKRLRRLLAIVLKSKSHLECVCSIAFLEGSHERSRRDTRYVRSVDFDVSSRAELNLPF
ncbi:MAG TPA: ATP-binding protein [Cellvibrionaceae bacterium]|nr:ATP-binding protein [Cellvibrionaceae bacterium]